MPKSKAVLALEEKVAALEAQLVLARTLYRELRDSHPVHQHDRANPQVTYWRDAHGALWCKTRIGNRATSRLVPANDAINFVAAGVAQ